MRGSFQCLSMKNCPTCRALDKKNASLALRHYRGSSTLKMAAVCSLRNVRTYLPKFTASHSTVTFTCAFLIMLLVSRESDVAETYCVLCPRSGFELRESCSQLAARPFCPSCHWSPTRPADDGFPAANFPPRWLSKAQRSFPKEQQYGQMGQSS